VEKAVRHLLDLARKRLPEATGYQRDCLEGGIREGQEILRLLANTEFDRRELSEKFRRFVIQMDEGGVIGDEQ
jgi:hypothetical protein